MAELQTKPTAQATRLQAAQPWSAALELLAKHWRLLLLVALLAALYATVLEGLWFQWTHDQDYSHGVLVPLFCGYLVWRKRAELARLRPEPSWFGLGIVLGSLALLFLGIFGAENFLTRVSLVGSIWGLVLYFGGWAFLRALVFPLGFLLLMVPLPVIFYNQIVFPLQLLASRFATTVLETANLFPVLREGNIIFLPNHAIEVVEACSGIRSLMTLLALTLGYGYLAESSLWVRGVLVAATVPVAIVSNGMRVVGTAFVTHYQGVEAADGFLHLFSGWLIFAVATILLLSLHGAILQLRRRLESGEAR